MTEGTVDLNHLRGVLQPYFLPFRSLRLQELQCFKRVFCLMSGIKFLLIISVFLESFLISYSDILSRFRSRYSFIFWRDTFFNKSVSNSLYLFLNRILLRLNIAANKFMSGHMEWSAWNWSNDSLSTWIALSLFSERVLKSWQSYCCD